MKAKRITAILMALTLTAALTACGESNIELAQADTQSEAESEYLEDLAEDEELAEGEDLTENEDLTEDEDLTGDEDLVEDEEPAEEVDYEVEDIEAVTMYASTSVSLRTGPSTDYEKVGSLSTNEAVTVTGVADTGWYRLNYKDTEVYVSNNYVQDTKVVSTASTSTDSTTSTSTDASSMFDDSDIPWATPVSDEELAALIASGAPVYVYGDGSDSPGVSSSYITILVDDSLLGYVNADRTANGVGELTWSSELEEYCKNRLPVIVANYYAGIDVHTGWTELENAARGQRTASEVNQSWIDSEGHHTQRIYSGHTQYAAATYRDANGNIFWIEAFK